MHTLFSAEVKMTHDLNSHGPIWRVLIAALLVSFLAATVSQRCFSADDQPAVRPDDAPAVLTITGVVRDAFVGRPISGAKVTVSQQMGKFEDQRFIKRFELVTDDSGHYKFDWRTDDLQNPPEELQGSDSPVYAFRIEARKTDYMTGSQWVPIEISRASPLRDSMVSHVARPAMIRPGAESHRWSCVRANRSGALFKVPTVSRWLESKSSRIRALSTFATSGYVVVQEIGRASCRERG